MKYLISFFLLSCLINWGCKNNEENNPVSSLSGMGKIQLIIDTENAPADVVTVEALLTRDGFDPIIGTLNIISDSTADILLDEIAAGVWHLKVDAKDGEGVVLYTGETDVEVFAGFVTNVNLVLNPTGEGKGSIYIFVTWGTQGSSWTDYELNPVLQSSGAYWEIEGVAQPKILIENNIYKMYYAGYAGAGYTYVGYAESTDGINWTRPLANPVLSPGNPGTWDSRSVQAGSIIREGNVYKMYYTGWADNYSNWHIGLATSPDGLNWTKLPQPVLYGTWGWEYQIHVATVLKYNGVYYMFYTGRNLPELKIGLATSTDGINWERYSGNPILSSSQSWEETGVYYPSVFREDNEFKMVYMNSAGTGFGMAYSSDGMNWTKDESNPFFTKEQTANNWASYKIAYPNLILTENNFRIYYSGIGPGNPYFRIGFVEK